MSKPNGISEQSKKILSHLEKNTTSEEIIFVSELQIKTHSQTPETLIAKIWHECLGRNAIPIEITARKALIEKGRKHTELKRHIEKWEKLKWIDKQWVAK